MNGSNEATPPGLKVQVMSALRWSAIAKFGGQIVNWGITLFVIRLLAPADYGIVAMLSILVTFLAMLGEMGFGSSIVQSKRLDETEIRTTFGATLVVNALLCAALVTAAPAVAAFYDEPRLVDMTRVAALGFLASGCMPVYTGLLERELRFKTIARIEIACAFATNILTLLIALAGWGAWALILAPLLVGPVRVAMLFATATRFYWPSFAVRGTRRLWSFGGSLLVTRMVWYWSSQADSLIAGKLLGKEALGFYSVASHLASLPMQRAASILNAVTFAAFAKIQDDPVAIASNVRLSIRLMALTTFPILWGIASVAPELVDLAIGPAWQPAILPMTVIALMIPFRMIGSNISTTIMSMGRVDIAMWTTIAGACIAPPLYYFGSRYGIVGLSLTWLVVTPLLFLLNMFRALPILGLSISAVFEELWRPALLAATMFVGVQGLRTWIGSTMVEPAVALALVLFGAALYVGGSWLLNRAAAAEALALLFPKRFARLGAAFAR